MEELFRDFNDFGKSRNYSISEKDGVHIIKLLVPGFTKDDLSVQANNEYVTIKGDISQDETLSNIGITRKMDYMFTLENLDSENIDLMLENGILTIKVKQKLPEEKKLKTIKF